MYEHRYPVISALDTHEINPRLTRSLLLLPWEWVKSSKPENLYENLVSMLAPLVKLEC